MWCKPPTHLTPPRPLQEYNENVHVLLTTGTPEAHALLSGSLPRRVVLQHAPFENAASIQLFLEHWKPQVGLGEGKDRKG